MKSVLHSVIADMCTSRGDLMDEVAINRIEIVNNMRQFMHGCSKNKADGLLEQGIGKHNYVCSWKGMSMRINVRVIIGE